MDDIEATELLAEAERIIGAALDVELERRLYDLAVGLSGLFDHVTGVSLTHGEATMLACLRDDLGRLLADLEPAP